MTSASALIKKCVISQISVELKCSVTKMSNDIWSIKRKGSISDVQWAHSENNYTTKRSSFVEYVLIIMQIPAQ